MRSSLINVLLVGAIAMLALTGCEYSELNGIGTRTGDEEFPPQLDLVSFDGCEPGELGRWQASGELLNNTPDTATYEVMVGFYEGEVRLDERSRWIRDIRPGERATLDASWWIQNGDSVTSCRVVLVNRFG
ncbi:MAG: hypothetical protein AAF531_26035 [Actinomycetota bacterium]